MPASEHLAHDSTNAKHILNLFQESAPTRRNCKAMAGCSSKSRLANIEAGKENNTRLEDDT